MKKLLAFLLVFCMLFALVACNGTEEPVDDNKQNEANDPSDSDTDPVDSDPVDSDPVDSDPVDSDPVDTDPVDTDPVDTDPIEPDEPEFELKLEDLQEIMQPIFFGDTVKNETVMFLDYGDEKSLIYPIDKVLAVTSYDGSVTYTEGKDYSVADGKIKILAGSSIPCITREKYYNTSDSTLVTSYNGQYVNTHWGEGKPMTDWQVNVTYTHTDSTISFEQECKSEAYESFINKLIAGEDVTVFFYGDSISRGANSSWERNYAPYQYPYTIVFTQALADLFDYKIHYIASGIEKSAKVPDSDYVAGDRGTITYVNTSIGGMTTENALSQFDTQVKPFVERYGCDLFVCAFGINDGNIGARTSNTNLKGVVDKLYSLTPDASVMIVSTMVPNPNAPKWYKYQYQQEALLLKTAENFRKKGSVCEVACMTSVSQAILERKDFNDYAGNNINHPNDFFIRVYAQTMLQTLLGYENIK